MGFQLPPNTATLIFEDGNYAGLEVKVITDATLEEMFDLPERLEGKPKEQYVYWATKLVAWNVEDKDGAPVPATFEGVWSQPYEFINFLIGEWRKAVLRPNAPLSETSSDGSTSAAE